MAINAHYGQALQSGCTQVSLHSAFVRNTKFIAFQTRRNVGMGLGVYVGVHAQTDRGFFTEFQGDIIEHFQLCFAFDIEATNPKLEGLLHFGACFAYPRKNDFLGRAAGCQNAGQFASRHNVKTTSRFGKDLQHRQIGVGLHGVANLNFAARKAALVSRQRRQHGRLGVSKNRCAVLGCHIC